MALNGGFVLEKNDVLPVFSREVIEIQTPDIYRSEDELRGKQSKFKCYSRGPGFWCKKYFWEGQELKHKPAPDYKDKLKSMPWSQRILIDHRRLVGFVVPALFFNFFWWAVFIKKDLWHLFPTNYPMTITMIFGSMIAGMTSEGGGAVAFPVMTLALKIAPSIARDFALMIQSTGMTAAAFTIYLMHVRCEWRSVLWCTIGGVGGMIFGLHIVDPALTPPVKKLGFVSIWFAFASVLLILNRTANRHTFNSIPNFNWWKALVLLVFGFLGGIFSSFSGSGIDICSFMVLTLLFRVSEKVATPTSVILMAINTLVGFFWRGVIMDAIHHKAWEYFAVCVPVVVFGAPIGSVLGTHFHRLVLAALVIILDTIALVSAFAIIRPLTPILIGTCVGIIVGCFVMFMLLTYAGGKLLDRYETSKAKHFVKTEYTLDYDWQGSVIDIRDKQVSLTITGNDNLGLKVGYGPYRCRSSSF